MVIIEILHILMKLLVESSVLLLVTKLVKRVMVKREMLSQLLVQF